MVKITYALPDGSGAVSVEADEAQGRDWAAFFNALMPLIAMIIEMITKKPVSVVAVKAMLAAKVAEAEAAGKAGE